MAQARKRLTDRLADAVDLMIDFATLGEYGLEPAYEDSPPSCQGRRRSPRSDVGIAAVDCADHLPAHV